MAAIDLEICDISFGRDVEFILASRADLLDRETFRVFGHGTLNWLGISISIAWGRE